MREEKFRLPGSSYEELAKIIRAYGNLTGEVAPGEVSKLTAIHPTSISRNNGFLVAIGVLEGGKKKGITEKGKALARALEHDMPDDIRGHWRNIVLENEFLQKVISAVRIRKGMEPSTLQAHVAYSAGQPKRPSVMTGAGAVVDILKAAGLVREEDGKLNAVVDRTARAEEPPEPIRDAIFPLHPSVVPKIATRTIEAGVGLTIQIQIQCSAHELENLAPKLRALIKEISSTVASEKPDTGE